MSGVSEQGMTKQSGADDEMILLAREAAEQVFNAKGSSSPSVYEPRTLLTARAAVRRLGELFELLPGSVADALEAAAGSGELLSSDRLQGLAEILQNADDAGASEVRLLLRDDDLLMCHNGEEMQLRHVLGVAMPWFSTKRAESGSFGRFGIGLSALRSISSMIEVHCSPYHVRLGQPVLISIEPAALPSGFDEDGWTVFRVSLTEGGVEFEELAGWIERWGDAGLLFLRNVAQITLRGSGSETLRRLSVSRDAAKPLQPDGAVETPVVHRQHVEAADGRSWMVYCSDVPSPAGVSRAHKKIEPTTPVGVALPLHRASVGQIYAGLPVVGTVLPVFLNAQFDPLTSRRDLADTPWNRALVPLVANVWSHAAVDMFRLGPAAAWSAMPVRPGRDAEEVSSLVARLNAAIVDIARNSVATRILVDVHGRGWFGLAELAVEAGQLEGVVAEDETATLLGLPATLPTTVRDTDGRWRAVLDDWREAGAELPYPLSVERALVLLQDPNRPVQSTIALVAAGVRDGLVDSLAELPCLVASDERRFMPPSSNSPEAVALEVSPLARELGVVTTLHVQHLEDTDDALVIVNWLRERGSLLDGTDDRIVIHRLASAGRSDQRIAEPLTDRQVDALRRAFELLDPAERREVGRGVGLAIMLSAYVHELRGGRKRRREMVASPIEAHLPRAIDRGKDSFAVAAERTPGVAWLNGRYAKALKSSSGRAGIGAQRFLALLGAEAVPRPSVHPDLRVRYSGLPWGLPAECQGSPAARSKAMEDRNATYTLRDWECQGLTAVAGDISRVRQARKRRTRARALLATMGRAWDRLSEFSEVGSADDYRTWIEKGHLPAFWVWQLREMAWLDDESGTPRRPSELRIRTRGNEAIYGEDAPDFLHSDLDGSRLERRTWQAAIAALGVTGDPTRQELVSRLKELRDGTVSGALPSERVERDSAIIYKALADSCKDAVAHADLRETDLRKEFREGAGLILTNLGWRIPDAVLAGPSIFGRYKAFAPPIQGAELLWKVLRLKTPSLSDCIQVLRQIARRKHPLPVDDEVVQIQTLRLLEELFRTSGGLQDRRKLATLRLWTSQGWKGDRPVFATDDETLADGLADRLPLWQPGGELDQFRSLMKPLRVVEIPSSGAEVIGLDSAKDDIDATELFRATVRQLQEDFVRNEPRLVQNLGIGWEALGEFGVRWHPNLMLSVRVHDSGVGRTLHCDVPVKVDPDRRIVFVKDPERDLPRADRGGRAVANLFEGERRRVAQAWRAAWDLAESGRTATLLELAQQKDKRRQDEIEAGIDQDLAGFRARTGGNGRSAGKAEKQRQAPSGEWATGGGVGTREAGAAKPRVLVNPDSLKVIDPNGRVVGSSTGRGPQRPGGGGLVEPRETSRAPRNKVALRSYSDLDRENVGLELARRVLSSERDDIMDLRTQCGVGADAMDQLMRFYELKVTAGDEPNSITLTNAELQRARSTPHFFLVVVSRVEGTDARPTVRIIPQPLNQLEQSVSGTMVLSGVREAKSVMYDFARRDEPVTSDNEDDVATTSD